MKIYKILKKEKCAQIENADKYTVRSMIKDLEKWEKFLAIIGSEQEIEN